MEYGPKNKDFLEAKRRLIDARRRRNSDSNTVLIPIATNTDASWPGSCITMAASSIMRMAGIDEAKAHLLASPEDISLRLAREELRKLDRFLASTDDVHLLKLATKPDSKIAKTR